ncbi:hypothetical protein MPSEU_000061600 [Mayamaea pseudoterrestris]|nr:hypothetical protein MPSEU_000061600 [Mayamaea pseudoterrestris]
MRMKNYLTCSVAFLWLQHIHASNAVEDDSDDCSTQTFRARFPVASSWLVYRQTVQDPVALRASGFADSSKASTITSKLECTPNYSSNFEITEAIVSKDDLEYQQDGLDVARTTVFEKASANGDWYISVEASGPATCNWILRITACEQRSTATRSNSNNSKIGENLLSDAPSDMPSLVPLSDVPSQFSSDIPSMFSTENESSDAPSDVPSIWLTSDVPTLVPTISLRSLNLSAAPSSVPTSPTLTALSSFAPTQAPTTEPTVLFMQMSAPSRLSSDKALSDEPSSIPTISPVASFISDAPSLAPTEATISTSMDSDEPSLAPTMKSNKTSRDDNPRTMLSTSEPTLPLFSDAPSDVPSASPADTDDKPSSIDREITTEPSQQSQSVEQPAGARPTFEFDDDIINPSSVTDSGAVSASLSFGIVSTLILLVLMR